MPTCPVVIATDHPAFPGHFPGQPIVPGVVLLDEAQRAVEAALGHPVSGLAMAKFLSVVRPGEALELRYEASAQAVRFSLHAGDRQVANGRFDLTPAP